MVDRARRGERRRTVEASSLLQLDEAATQHDRKRGPLGSEQVAPQVVVDESEAAEIGDHADPGQLDERSQQGSESDQLVAGTLRRRIVAPARSRSAVAHSSQSMS